jgi:hypothetical protein
MKAAETLRGQEPASSPLSGFRRTVAGIWDLVVGPPRYSHLPDGGVTVKLLGRRFQASTPDALFDAVARERERLLTQLGKLHEGAVTRPMMTGGRFSDTYHQQSRRLEDRIALYSAFLGRLGQELDLD